MLIGAQAWNHLPLGAIPDSKAHWTPDPLPGLVADPNVDLGFLVIARPREPNWNLLVHTDSPSEMVSSGEGGWVDGGISYGESVADPEGGTDAWSVTSDDLAADEHIRQNFTLPFKGRPAMRIKLQAGGAGGASVGPSISGPSIAGGPTIQEATVWVKDGWVKAGWAKSRNEVTTAHIASTATLYAPTVSQAGAQAVTGAHIASTAATTAPTLAYAVTTVAIASTLSLFAPTVGQVALGAHISSTATLYPPTVFFDQPVTGEHISSTATLYAPTVALEVPSEEMTIEMELNGTPLTVERARILNGPGLITISGTDIEVTNLSTSEWTEIEIVWTNEVLEETPGYSLFLYPGGRPQSAATIKVFRPHPQVALPRGEPLGVYTFSQHKTERVNGPDGALGKLRTFYLSNFPYISDSGDNPSSEQFWPVLKNPYQIFLGITSGGILGDRAVPRINDVSMANPGGELDRLLYYCWHGRQIDVYAGPKERVPFNQFTRVLPGTSKGIGWNERQVSLSFRDLSHLMDVRWALERYKGFGPCLRYNSGDYCNAANDSDFVIPERGGWGIELWFTLRTTSGTQTLIRQLDGTLGPLATEGFALWLTATGVLTGHVSDGTNGVQVTRPASPEIRDGETHHVALDWDRDGDDILRLYVDGELIDEGDASSVGFIDNGSGAGSLRISNNVNGVVDGEIDEVRIWGRHRTAEEIKANKDRPLDGTESGVIQYWNFNEGTGAIADPTMTRAYNRQLDLDGNEYVTVSSHSSLHPSGSQDLSVEICFKSPYQDATAAKDGHLVNMSDTFNLDLSQGGSDTWLSASVPGVAARAQAQNVVQAHRWHWVTATYEFSRQRVLLYLDGVQIAEAFNLFTHTWPASTDDLLFGAFQGVDEFTGQIAVARWWVGRLLTPAEVADFMHREVDAAESGLAGYWKFDETSGTSVPDETSNNNDGTITATGGTATWLDHQLDLVDSPPWVTMLEGGPELAGKPKPESWGQIFNVQPVLIDDQRLVYQVHPRQINSVLGVRDDGVAVTFDTDSNDIYAAAPAANEYRTALVRGVLRLESVQQSGSLTCDVEGDAVSGYVSKPGEVMNRNVSLKASTVSIATSDLDSIDAVFPATMAIFTGTEENTLLDMLTRMVQSIGAWWEIRRDSSFTAKLWELPSAPVASIDDDDYVRGSLRRLPTPGRVWRVNVRYRPNYAPQNPESLSNTLTAEQKNTYSQRWLTKTSEFGVAPVPTDDTCLPMREKTVEAYIVEEKWARSLADRLKSLEGDDKDIYTLGVKLGLFSFYLGDQIRTTISRGRLHSGRDGTILAIQEQGDPNRVELEVWTKSETQTV